MKITDEMVTAGRGAQQSCDVAIIGSNAREHPLGWGTIMPTAWFYDGKTFATLDAAKDAQQRDIVRAILEAALGARALVGEAGDELR